MELVPILVDFELGIRRWGGHLILRLLLELDIMITIRRHRGDRKMMEEERGEFERTGERGRVALCTEAPRIMSRRWTWRVLRLVEEMDFQSAMMSMRAPWGRLRIRPSVLGLD